MIRDKGTDNKQIRNREYLNPQVNAQVTVIIPTYNRPRLIGRAIKSVLNQIYQNFEIVVVDDSPNDETEKVVKNFKDNRIKYIRNRTKTNLSKARNQGVKESNPKSSYVAFLDDDDKWFPNFLEETIKEFEGKSDLIGVSPFGARRLGDGTMLPVKRGPVYRFWENGAIGNSWVLKKKLFKEENFWFDEELSNFEDLDFGIRVSRNHRVEIMPKILWMCIVLPLSEGESLFTDYKKQAINIDYFFDKHRATYAEAGKKALAFLYYFTGKIYCQAGRIKKGREHLKEALKINSNLEYLIYYLTSLICPQIFQNYRLQFLKHKILRD